MSKENVMQLLDKEYVRQLEEDIHKLRVDYIKANCDNVLLKDKLSKYKAFEKKIGCSLEVMSSALENGIYTKEYETDTELELFKVRGIEKNGVSVISKLCSYAECDFTCEYKDYKKTWFLKKDKSE